MNNRLFLYLIILATLCLTVSCSNPYRVSPAKNLSESPLPTPTIAPVYLTNSAKSQLANPILIPIDVNNLPITTHDLLYIDDGRLMRWNHSERKVELLISSTPYSEIGSLATNTIEVATQRNVKGKGPITGSLISFQLATQERFFLVIYEGIQNGEQLFSLNLFDLTTHQITKITPEFPYLRNLQSSPDGKKVAFITNKQSPQTYRASGLGLLLPAPVAGDWRPSRAVKMISIDDPYTVTQIAQIMENSDLLSELLWSPDGQHIAWADSQGVWSSDLEKSTVHAVLTNNRTENGVGNRIFSISSWSPSGEFLLGSESFYEGGSWIVIEPKTGNIVEVPNSFEYSHPNMRTTWLSDDKLLITRPEYGFENVKPRVEIWEIDISTQLSLKLISEYVLPGMPEDFPTAPTLLSTNQIGLAILNADPNNTSRGLYRIDIREPSLWRVAKLPRFGQKFDPGYPGVFGESILWAPDGSGAIVSGYDPRLIFYASAYDGKIYDLEPIFADRSCCFMWVQN